MSFEYGPSPEEINFTMSHEHSSSEQIDQQFERNYALVQEFAANPQEFLDKLVEANPEAAEKCFNATELEVCCIDGRLRQGNVAIAGSGCLHQNPEAAIEYAKAVANQQGQEVIGLTSHEGCGAAGMKQIDAAEFSQDLSESTNLPYTRHLEVFPADYHDEVVIYYSGNKSLGLQDLPGLPAGFRLSRRFYPTTESAVYEADVATQIAFGDHGFGHRFTPEKPLIIVALGDAADPQFSAEALAQELVGLASDRVRIVQVNYQSQATTEELPLAA